MTSRGVCLIYNKKKSNRSAKCPSNNYKYYFFAAIKHLKYLVFKKISNKSRGLKNTNLN